MEQQIIRQLETLRKSSPLVHNITNYVAMNNTANALLAIGASPVMAHSPAEVKDIVRMCHALVINIGTLSEPWAEAMLLAATEAKDIGCPWLLDPVGAGISSHRNDLLKELLLLAPTAIRGNASEIIALDNFGQSSSKGVDSTVHSGDALLAGRRLQQRYGSQVCISGATDYIIGKDQWVAVQNGNAMMTKVTALGCTASAIVGAFLGLRQDSFSEAIAGVSIVSLAGELAAKESHGPGSLQVNLYDRLYNLSAEELQNHLHVTAHAY